ncbi:hypothetical protein B0T22DRAFT_193755 [Podospora appendiculata]|uniref:Uncharacterized protein n=1 Tax=Podospora appendiculata TaxID=314037 RepID=A0AAE1CEA3_9PEZI|nr:hypothetical protein B0T22DRAFT_193755 [Podospora appendiculata]
MSPILKIFTMVFLKLEDAIVGRILQSPRFHHGVRKIHRTVEDLRYGRSPNEPLRPGEATEDPNLQKVRADTFFKHFLDELRSQAGTSSTKLPPGPPKP